MAYSARAFLIRQLETGWMLAEFHFQELSTEECLWRPAPQGPHVRQSPDGRWHADWPDHERYDLGPASIAWLSWRLGFWLSMALNHSFGDGSLTRQDVA